MIREVRVAMAGGAWQAMQQWKAGLVWVLIAGLVGLWPGGAGPPPDVAAAPDVPLMKDGNPLPGVNVSPVARSADLGPIYVCDLHDHYLDHHEYCRLHSDPGAWCARFGPSPEGKSFDDLLYDYDLTIFAATLQGIINKAGPRLYFIHDGEHVSGGSVDRFWLDRFRDGSKPYGWLAGREVVEIHGLDGLLNTFASEVAGAVIWDNAVPATLNVATTMAGVENWVVLRDGSRILPEVTARIPVKASLVGKFVPGAKTIPDSATPSTGSPKDDAYIWAKEQYLDTARADATLLAYFEDGWPAVLYSRGQMTRKGTYTFERDYIVQNRGFVFDVSPFETAQDGVSPERPIDDPSGPPGVERQTFRAILASARTKAGRQMIRVWGFVPWYQKYSNAYEAGGTHSDVESEWESSWLFSAHGAYLEGGGGDVNGIALANVSFHVWAPFPERVVQNPPPTQAALMARGLINAEGTVANKTYILYYAGDYDLAHNLYGHTNEIAASLAVPAEMRAPLAWGLNPALVRVLPGIVHYWMSQRSEADYFVGPNSGAGYLNPGALPEALVPAWVAHSLEYYRRLGYSIQGWTLNGKGGRLPAKKAALFLDLGGDGVSFYPSDLEGPWPRLERGIPVVAMAIPGLPWTVDEAVPVVRQAYEGYVRQRGDGPKFIIARLTCCTRREFWELTQRLKADPGPRYEVVDPYTFFYLLRVFLGGSVTSRASYLSDNVPTLVKAGTAIDAEVTVRNDGWETWREGGAYQLGIHLERGAIPPRALLQKPGAYPVRVVLPQAVPPGGTAVLHFSLAVPAQPGRYTLQYDMINLESGPFEGQNDLPWQKVLIVEP